MKTILLFSMLSVFGLSGLFAQEGVYTSINKAQKDRYWITKSPKKGWVVKATTGSQWTELKLVSYTNQSFTIEDDKGNNYVIAYKKGNGTLASPDQLSFRKDNTGYTLVWASEKP